SRGPRRLALSPLALAERLKPDRHGLAARLQPRPSPTGFKPPGFSRKAKTRPPWPCRQTPAAALADCFKPRALAERLNADRRGR
ncbi:MAG: hypothetical protein LBE01_05380, partial [Deltaproteobacteria bacterium]|nr:hypothetical protein [Deltaproteobacteria bacterium]